MKVLCDEAPGACWCPSQCCSMLEKTIGTILMSLEERCDNNIRKSKRDCALNFISAMS